MAEARHFHCYSHVSDNRVISANSCAETDKSVRPGQTDSELDVQTSGGLLNFETDQ